MHISKPAMSLYHERTRPDAHIDTLSIRRLKDVLNQMYPDLTLLTVDELLSTQLARLYILAMSDGQKLLLSCAPKLNVRLLRHETTMLSSEASLVRFLEGIIPNTPICSRQKSRDTPRTISRMIPTLLKHSSNNKELAYPHSIFEAPAGDILSDISPRLTGCEATSVNKQVGIMARTLASITSPTRMFGTVDRVLPQQYESGVIVSNLQKGLKTWSEAFNHLLEGVLRDGEDMSVLIPYEKVRTHFKRSSWQLDKVVDPRLLILDMGTESSIMISREIDGDSTTPRLTGIRSWSQGVFGDPLLSTCFDEPDYGFLEGWEEAGEEIIKDGEDAELRIMLYQCFRSIVAIVTEYYRPRNDSGRREMEARRKLTNALARLDKLDGGMNEDLKRTRRRSKVNDELKRIRIEDKSCGKY